MELGETYSDQQLIIKTELSEYIVKNAITLLRTLVNFVYNNEIHHIAYNQITKKTFAYILKKGIHTPETDTFLPNE